MLYYSSVETLSPLSGTVFKIKSMIRAIRYYIGERNAESEHRNYIIVNCKQREMTRHTEFQDRTEWIIFLFSSFIAHSLAFPCLARLIIISFFSTYSSYPILNRLSKTFAIKADGKQFTDVDAKPVLE